MSKFIECTLLWCKNYCIEVTCYFFNYFLHKIDNFSCMKEILHEHYRVGTQYSYSKGEKSLSNIFDVNDFEALTSLQVSGSSVLHFLHLEEVDTSTNMKWDMNVKGHSISHLGQDVNHFEKGSWPPPTAISTFYCFTLLMLSAKKQCTMYPWHNICNIKVLIWHPHRY